MSRYYVVESLEEDRVRRKSISSGDEVFDSIMNKPFSEDEGLSPAPIVSGEGYIWNSLQDFIEEDQPKAFWLDDDFYKKVEKRLYVECRTVGEAQKTELQNPHGTAKEEKIEETDRKIIDFR